MGGSLFYILALVFIVIATLCLNFFGIVKKRKKDKNSKAKVYAVVKQQIQDSGFTYDEKQDIFYSEVDAWQREYGYCAAYDESAAPCSMIIHSEPIYFVHQNKQLLIQLWKGQYGLTTGAEVGFYQKKADVDVEGVFRGDFYESVADRDMLHMGYALLKDKNTLCTREGVHWWLTAFKVGEFSEPEDLSMDISIEFKSSLMAKSFCEALHKLGYQFSYSKGVVSFVFDTPKTEQPHNQKSAMAKMNQAKNKFLCQIYDKMIGDLADADQILEILKIGKGIDVFSSFAKFEKNISGGK